MWGIASSNSWCGQSHIGTASINFCRGTVDLPNLSRYFEAMTHPILAIRFKAKCPWFLLYFTYIIWSKGAAPNPHLHINCLIYWIMYHLHPIRFHAFCLVPSLFLFIVHQIRFVHLDSYLLFWLSPCRLGVSVNIFSPLVSMLLSIFYNPRPVRIFCICLICPQLNDCK